MPWSRRTAAVLLALSLAGCTTEETPDQDRPAGTPAGSPATPGDGGAFDAVAGSEPLPVIDDDHAVVGSALDPDGNPVVLATQIEGEAPLILLRRDGDGAWTDLSLDDQDSLGFSADLHVAEDGTAVVTGFAGGVFSVTRVTADGEVSTVPVAAELAPDRIGGLSTAITPAGDVVHVGYADPPSGTGRLLAVDAATGAVRAEASIPGGEPGRAPYPAHLAVAPDGGLLVAVNSQLDDEPIADATTLTRYDATLQPLGDVALPESAHDTVTWALDLTDDGTAVLAVRVGGDEDTEGGPDTGLRLLTVAPGAAATTEVAFVPERYSIDDLAVDPAGNWLYLAGLQEAVVPSDDRTVTAVDLATGELAEPLLLCPGYVIGDLLLDVDGEQAVATTRCEDDDGAHSLWELS